MPFNTAVGGGHTLGDYVASWSSLTANKIIRTQAMGHAEVQLPGWSRSSPSRWEARDHGERELVVGRLSYVGCAEVLRAGSAMTKREPLETEPRDAGVSLVEVLVGVGLFATLGVLLLGLALSTGKVTSDTRALANVSEESRLAMERMTRELRQSSGLTAVELPGGSSTS